MVEIIAVIEARIILSFQSVTESLALTLVLFQSLLSGKVLEQAHLESFLLAGLDHLFVEQSPGP